MTLNLWLAYVSAILIMMSTPGPSQLLMLSNSVKHGFRRSLATVAGDLSANILQMLAAGLGLATLIVASRDTFIIIKWLGVAYLIYIGLRLILARPVEAGSPAQSSSRKTLYLQGFVTSAVNPRAVVFFAALFPQFLTLSEPLGPQLLILGVTYLTIDGLVLSAYGSSAENIAKRMSGRIRLYQNRFAGFLLIGAAVLLGMRDIKIDR